MTYDPKKNIWAVSSPLTCPKYYMSFLLSWSFAFQLHSRVARSCRNQRIQTSISNLKQTDDRKQLELEIESRMVRASALKPSSKFFLRKHRKWPVSPYNTRWHQIFNQNQAFQSLKKSSPPPENQPHLLLPTLVYSFNTYNVDPTPEAYHFVLKTLTKTAQFDHIAPVLRRLETVEKFDTPEHSFAHLIGFYGRWNRTQDAIDLFYRIPRFRCVPSAHSLNALLYVLCGSCEGLKLVPEILLRSHVMGIRLEESSFRFLINALCGIGKVGYAIDIMNCMMNNGYGLNVKICSLILSSMCEQKDSEGVDVMGFLGEMQKLGFCPGMMDYSNVIRFMVKQGRGLHALNVLIKMKGEGIKPDVICYTMVLHGVITEGDFKKADQVFDELLVLGLVPDVYTYNVYINGLCKQNKVESGLMMISSMDELGCKPNLITYNILLKALCNNGELRRVRELMREMTLNGVGVNLQTHRIMLDGLFGKGNIEEACVFMEEMLDKVLVRFCSSFDEVIYGLCQRGLVCKAMELLKKMVDKNVAPGAKAWEALLLSSGSEPSLEETTWTGLVEPMVSLP
ncbi:pentatricopeptide repeat-containing protein At2g38420, mitochondrial [Pyrus communis]|uniref:pentatricopeptide repeat-containing protein At2g38420, mitochondrial n=1 Tax=Pyrus communis TaxID=23211 RepID=UPI0035C237E5